MINAPWYNSAIECTAFNAYAINESDHKSNWSKKELDEFGDALVEEYHNTGRCTFNLEGNDLTDEEFEYLQEYVNRRT